MVAVKRIIKIVIYQLLSSLSTIIIEGIYGGIWAYRLSIENSKIKKSLYTDYLRRYGCFIGLGARFEDIPTLPHRFNGIHIS